MVERLGVALDPKDIGFYLGLMSTVFLLAQCITSPIWGRLSDTFGRRKPFVLSGAFGTMMGFLWFGLSETYTMVLTIPLYAKLLAILGLALVGLSNNSTEIISTIVGELTDASNQSTAFASLPISWWLGGAIGPLVGAAMISPPNESGAFGRFPYLTVLVIPVTLRFLLPNLVVVTLLAIEFVVVLLFLKESHHGAVNIPRNLPTILAALRRRLWRWFTSNQSPTILEPEEGTVSAQVPLLGDPASHSQIVVLETTIIRVLSVNIILIIGTLAVNELCAAGYNKLLLLLLSSLKPTGLALTTNEIAYAFSATSVASILIQSLCFTTVERRFGFTQCYRASLLLSGFCCFYTPFIRLASGPVSLWVLLIGGVSLGFLANLLASTCSLLLVLFLWRDLIVYSFIVTLRKHIGFIIWTVSRGFITYTSVCSFLRRIFMERVSGYRTSARVADGPVHRMERVWDDFYDCICRKSQDPNTDRCRHC